MFAITYLYDEYPLEVIGCATTMEKAKTYVEEVMKLEVTEWSVTAPTDWPGQTPEGAVWAELDNAIVSIAPTKFIDSHFGEKE